MRSHQLRSGGELVAAFICPEEMGVIMPRPTLSAGGGVGVGVGGGQGVASPKWIRVQGAYKEADQTYIPHGDMREIKT